MRRPRLAAGDRKEARNPMVLKLMHWLERLTGAILGSFAVGMQMVNVLICIFVILMGPALVLKLAYA